MYKRNGRQDRVRHQQAFATVSIKTFRSGRLTGSSKCVLFTEKKRKKFLNKITHTDSCRKQKQTKNDGGKLCNHHLNPDLKYAWNSEELDVLLSCTQTNWQKESLIYAYLWLYRMPGATDFNPVWHLFWLKLCHGTRKTVRNCGFVIKCNFDWRRPKTPKNCLQFR